VAKKIEGKEEPAPQVLELARFADKEVLMKRARQAGLPPREQELFRLVFGNPDRFLRNGKLNHSEAARELGVAVGTTKSLWSKIRRTLAV
jgi:DNA-directed RNA polymerase specialized sigma24 family protein